MKFTTSPSFERLALIAILVVYAGAGLLYNASSPFLEVSDEVRHYAMVEHLAQGRGLPVQDPANHGFYEQEGSQPPLYYALMALAVQPFDRADFLQLAQFNPHARLGRADTTNNWNQLVHGEAEQWPWRGTPLAMHLIRLLGLAMGAVTVLCAYELTRGLAPGRLGASAPIIAAALVAFNPMFVFISASVNNDTLATMLSAVALVLGARAVRLGLSARGAVTLGVVLGCAALTKSSALALVIVIPAAIVLREIFRPAGAKTEGGLRANLRGALTGSLALRMALIVLPVAAIAGWWYVRNQVLYGDVTGTTMMAAIAGPRLTPPTLLALIGEWDGFRKSFWGLFGAVNIPMANWMYTVLDVVSMAACAGLALIIKDALSRWTRQAALERGRVIAALMCLGAIAVALAALARWTSITLASQGRLLFPVIAAIAAFLALGLARLWRGTSVLLPVVLAALALACPMAYIQPAYALPARLAGESQLPPDGVKTEMRFGDAIRWIGYRVDQTRLYPGGEFGVTLYWQGLKPMSTNFSAFVKLYARDGVEAAALDTYPGGGMWQTTRWQTGQVIADSYRLRLTGTLTTPAVLRMDVGFWDFATQQFLQAFDAQGQAIGRLRYEVAGVVGSQSTEHRTQSTEHRTQSTDGASLSHAVPVSVTVEQRDGKLWVATRWVATQDFGEAFTLFMHLVDGQGKLIGQADGPAMNGDFPVRWWRVGDEVDDKRAIILPAGTPPGEYQLEYGFYRPGDGSRLPAFDAQGQPIPDAAIKSNITVK